MSKILIIEDEAAIRRVLSKIISEENESKHFVAENRFCVVSLSVSKVLDPGYVHRRAEYN